MLKKSRFAALLLLLAISVLGSPAYAAQNPEKPMDIAITFHHDAKTEKSFNWITKGTTLTNTVLNVWKENGEVMTFQGVSEQVQGYLAYDSDKTKFYAAANETKFIRHKVTAMGLESGTTYYYRCGDGNEQNWSDIGTFTTGIESGDFTFLYITDPQSFYDKDFALWQNTSEHALQKYPDAAFVTLAGDLVDRGCSENLWDRFFSYGKLLTVHYTVAPAIGNHETDTGPHTFDKHFYFPENEKLPDYVYSFDYSNAHFMVLSTEMTYGQMNSTEEAVKEKVQALLNNQIEWLRQEVKESGQKWNIVILHKALYASGAYYNDGTVLALRNALAPVFDELSIDAVLQGHDHTFSKAFLYQDKTPAGLNSQSAEINKTTGTFYLINNTAGPKFYNISNDSFPYLLKYIQPKQQMYTGVTVTESKLQFDTYLVAEQDELFDTFTVYK